MKQLTRKGHSTRDRILNESLTLLQEQWYDGVSLREVAKRCEIKLGNLQYYFATREALFFALVERQADQDNEAIAQMLEEAESAEAALDLIIRDLFRRWRRHDGAIYIVLQLLRGSADQFADLYRTVYERHYQSLEPLIEQLNPGLSPAERSFKAKLITSLIDGATMQIVDATDRDAFLERIVAEAMRLARLSNTE
ncbi:MAG: TetR/AcrR family transcriptional regulator [Pseudomonadota bacterium]